MLATTMLPSIAPAGDYQHALSLAPAPEIAASVPKLLCCSWAVDPATGTLRSQWGMGGRP